LEWQRYWQWMTTDFLQRQREIVKQYKPPEQCFVYPYRAGSDLLT
jgi:hypothetical protein